MKKIDLTFGIPVYNSAEYIGDLLNCFKSTDLFNYEVIIVDDGSSDNSYSVCKGFKNSNFRVFKKENGGVSSARNFIIEHAHGEFLTFVDADDLIDFKKYVEIFEKIKHSDCEYWIGIRNKKKYFNKQITQISYLVENELINSPVDKFYKLNIINTNNVRFDNRFSLGEDLLFNMLYLKSVYSFNPYFSDNMYIIRRINNNSLTKKIRKDKFEELMNVNRIITSDYHDKRINMSFEYIRIKNCLSCAKDMLNNKEEYSFKTIFQNIKRMKKYKKKDFCFLNTMKTSLIYNAWYYCPTFLLLLFIIIINKHYYK